MRHGIDIPQRNNNIIWKTSMRHNRKSYSMVVSVNTCTELFGPSVPICCFTNILGQSHLKNFILQLDAPQSTSEFQSKWQRTKNRKSWGLQSLSSNKWMACSTSWTNQQSLMYDIISVLYGNLQLPTDTFITLILTLNSLWVKENKNNNRQLTLSPLGPGEPTEPGAPCKN